MKLITLHENIIKHHSPGTIYISIDDFVTLIHYISANFQDHDADGSYFWFGSTKVRPKQADKNRFVDLTSDKE